MRGRKGVCAVLVAAAVLCGAGGAAAASTPVGTWTGSVRDLFTRPGDYRPALRLVVGARTASALFSGLTGASHDAPTATTTCTIRFAFARVAGPWRYYKQAGKVAYPGGQYVTNAPCGSLNYNELRVTRSGAQLRAEFAWGPQATFAPADKLFRGYLRKTG